MQLAAKHADIWESSYLSPEQFVSINSEFEKISNLTKTFVKSIELDFIIATELEYKKRLFAMKRGPAVLSQLLKHSLVELEDQPTMNSVQELYTYRFRKQNAIK